MSRNDKEIREATEIPTMNSKKKVHFAGMTRFKRVRPHYLYTKHEHEATWYSDTELQTIVQDCITTCKMMLDGELVLEEEGFCTRGLETRIAASSASSYRKINKSRAIRVVLQECKTQKTMGVHEPEYLALLYSKVTKETRRTAHLMALRDQEVARTIHAPLGPTSSLGRPTWDKKQSNHQGLDPTSPVSDTESSVSCSTGRRCTA